MGVAKWAPASRGPPGSSAGVRDGGIFLKACPPSPSPRYRRRAPASPSCPRWGDAGAAQVCSCDPQPPHTADLTWRPRAPVSSPRPQPHRVGTEAGIQLDPWRPLTLQGRARSRQAAGRGSGPSSPHGARRRRVREPRPPPGPRPARLDAHTLTPVPATAPPALLGQAGASDQRPPGGLERVHGRSGRRCCCHRQNSVRENFPPGPGGARAPRSSPPRASSAPTSDGAGRGPARPRPWPCPWPPRRAFALATQSCQTRAPPEAGADSPRRPVFSFLSTTSLFPTGRSLRVGDPPHPSREAGAGLRFLDS